MTKAFVRADHPVYPGRSGIVLQNTLSDFPPESIVLKDHCSVFAVVFSDIARFTNSPHESFPDE